MTTVPESAGFVAFYRRYTKTWLHALATAALTAFGALSILHRGFVLLAVAAYVLPPLALYFAWPALSGSRRLPGTEPGSAGTDRNSAADPDRDRSPRETTDEEGGETTVTETSAPPDRWSAVDAPTDADLLDAAVAAGGAYAVGEGGVVLADDGSGWTVALPDGPGAAGNALRGVDATADGEAVWVAGDGGALARLERETGRHVDHSAPRDRTDTWEDVAVGGPDDDELVLLVNGSGELLRGRYRDGDLAWDDPTKPGSGSSMSGVVLASADEGYCCDTNAGVYEVADGGARTSRIGIDSAEGTPTDVAAAREGPLVSSDAGILYRRDGGAWTPLRLGEAALSAVAVGDERGLACGDRAVFERATSGADWERSVTPASSALAGVGVGPTRAVAVGEGGTVVESG